MVVGIPCALCGNDVRAWNGLECGEVPEETVIAEFRLLGRARSFALGTAFHAPRHLHGLTVVYIFDGNVEEDIRFAH